MTKSSVHYIVIFIVCFFSSFIHNEVIPSDLMEARNLVTAQEIVDSGDYLVPTMNGELRLEKPPLPTWIAAGIEIVFPDNIKAQRNATALSASLMIFFLYLVAYRLSHIRTFAFISALVLATSLNVVLMSRTATWDIYCHSFMLGAIYFLIGALEKETHQWRNFLLAGIFMGLSFLSKGPVAFYALLLPFIVSYSIIYRPKIKGKIIPLLSMVFICLLISFWWPAYIFIFHQDLAVFVAGKETTSWINHNVRPWYYYWQFPFEAGIWSLFWITSLVYFFIRKRTEQHKIYALSFIWLIASLILLSFIPEKKIRYLLPLAIPGAINIALYIYHSTILVMNRKDKLIFKINAFLIGIILIAMPIAIYFLSYKEGYISGLLLIIITLISWILSIFIFRAILNKQNIKVMTVFTVIILTMIMVTGLCLIPIKNMFVGENRRSIKLLRNNTEVQKLPFYYSEEEGLRMEIVYEANRIIHPMDLKNDSLIYKSLPFVFVSSVDIDSLFGDKKVVIKNIDTFDNNWNRPEDKKYNKRLISRVAIIKAE